MVSQIRIYTINKGEMDNFLKHFKEDVMAVHERIGVPIVGTWVNRPQTSSFGSGPTKIRRTSKRRTKRSRRRSRPPALSWDRTSPRWKSARSNRRLHRSGFDTGPSLGFAPLPKRHHGLISAGWNHLLACRPKIARSASGKGGGQVNFNPRLTKS